MNDKKSKQKSIIAWIMEYSRSKRSLYTASVILAVLGVICSMMPYYLISRIIVQLLSGEKRFEAYMTYLLLIGVFWTLRVVFHSLSTSMSHKATFNVLANIRLAMCSKLTRLPLGDVKGIPSGELKSIMVERVDSMETTLAHILPEFTANLLAPVLVFIYICTFSWKLALASLITLPIGFLCTMFMMKDSAWRWEDCVKKTKALNDTAVEYINGIEVIKVFGKTDSSYAKFEKAAHDGAYCYIDEINNNSIYYRSQHYACNAFEHFAFRFAYVYLGRNCCCRFYNYNYTFNGDTASYYNRYDIYR